MDNGIMTERIKFLCKKNKVTAKKMLEDTKINRSFLYDVGKREAKPTVEKIEKIADYFNVSVDYILGRTDNTEINK